VVEAVNHLNVRSCLIDGEVVCCDERGLAIFSTLRRRRNEARAFLFAFDLLELDGLDMRREPIETRKATLTSLLRKGQAWGASERAHSASQRRRRVPARLQLGRRGNCFEATGIAVQVRPLARLAQVEESGCAGDEAGGGRGVG
jgi:ATP dependent DNA ligase domain